MHSSYKGKILISTPDISGDIFSRSVVLVIEHNEDGAFGLILNKRNKEIAEELEISVKAVEGQISKALKVFKSSLTDYLPLVSYLFVG